MHPRPKFASRHAGWYLRRQPSPLSAHCLHRFRSAELVANWHRLSADARETIVRIARGQGEFSRWRVGDGGVRCLNRPGLTGRGKSSNPHVRCPSAWVAEFTQRSGKSELGAPKEGEEDRSVDDHRKVHHEFRVDRSTLSVIAKAAIKIRPSRRLKRRRRGWPTTILMLSLPTAIDCYIVDINRELCGFGRDKDRHHFQLPTQLSGPGVRQATNSVDELGRALRIARGGFRWLRPPQDGPQGRLAQWLA